MRGSAFLVPFQAPTFPSLAFRTTPAFRLTSNSSHSYTTAHIVSVTGQDTECENVPVHGPFKGREEV